MEQKNQSNSNLIVASYIISILPVLLMPIVFTPVGVIIGVLNISKRETGHGILQILFAVIAGIWGTHVGGAGFGLPKI